MKSEVNKEMATPAPAEWLPKKEAAALLGVSTRQVERYAESGRIRMQLARLPGERTDRNVYALEDLEKLNADRAAPAPKLLPFPEAMARTESPAIAALTAILQQTAQPRIERAWLTLDEAAAYSGLPASEIARLVRDKDVYAIGQGHVTWRIQRESLDEWGRMVHLVPKKR